MSVGHHRGASSVRGEIDLGPMTAQRRACVGGPETRSRPNSEAGHKRGNPLGVKDLRYGVLFYCKGGEGPIDSRCRRTILFDVGRGYPRWTVRLAL